MPTVVGGPYEYGVPGAVHGIFKPPAEAKPVPAGVGGQATRDPGIAANEHEHFIASTTILVVANETIGGRKLLDEIRRARATMCASSCACRRPGRGRAS